MSITAVPLKPVKRRVLVYLWVAIAAAFVAAAALAFQTPVDPNVTFLARNAKTKGVVTTPSGLQYLVLAPGHGPTPTDEDIGLVGYEGKLTDGTPFDASTPQQPLVLPFGTHSVVPGFEEAARLVPVGGRLRAWIKPALAYGDKATGPIPPNSILVFDLEMVDFKSKQWVREQQARQQMLQGGAGAGVPAGALPPGGVPQGAAPPPPVESAPGQ